MKSFNSAALTAILATATFAAHASSVDQADLAQCKSQISGNYGDDQDIKYVGQRRLRDGMQMKFAVRNEDAATGYTSTHMATCLLNTESMQASAQQGEGPLIAEAYDATTDAAQGPLGM